jgi:hypothetical protein
VSSPQSPREPLSSSERTEREENSGVIHLAALGAGSAVAEAPVTREAPRPSLASGAPSRRPGPLRKKRSWVGISSLVAVAAVAVGVVLFGSRHAPHEEPSAAVAVATSPPQIPLPAPAAAPAQPVLAVASAARDDRGVDPASLPPASTATGVPHGVTPAATLASARPAVATSSARATTPEVVAAAPAPGAAPSAGANLQTLMQQAAGVTSAPAAPATTSPETPPPALGSVPLRPSQGALQGALGAALPSARACLGPDDAISHATITFGSDGNVVSVGVSGGAAGKPSEGCIRAALMKTRVPPFAQPTFTGTATVRPN